MTDADGPTGHDDFVRMNANPAFVAGEFTDVILDLMRAIAADDDPTTAVYRASDKMHRLIEFMAAIEGGVSFHELFGRSVELLRANAEKNSGHDNYLEASRAGMRFLAEASCFDNAARGRAASRLSTFIPRVSKLGGGRSPP